MSEKPILMSSPMVRAILEGRKTQTRRVAKKQPISGDVKPTKDDGIWSSQTERSVVSYFSCPYGQPGDRLWVRETFQHTCDVKGDACVRYKADGKAMHSWANDSGEGDWVKVSGECVPVDNPHWKPSIFMPRWASRITLELTAVRVERVQDIGEDDAIAEGIERDAMCGPLSWYQTLWDSINAKRGFGWAVNPWVWVIEFRKITP